MAALPSFQAEGGKKKSGHLLASPKKSCLWKKIWDGQMNKSSNLYPRLRVSVFFDRQLSLNSQPSRSRRHWCFFFFFRPRSHQKRLRAVVLPVLKVSPFLSPIVFRQVFLPEYVHVLVTGQMPRLDGAIRSGLSLFWFLLAFFPMPQTVKLDTRHLKRNENSQNHCM